MAKAKRKKRNVPWLPLIKFHQEIVARAEDSFFSLNARDDQDDRWTNLRGFQPTSLAGPWEVNGNSLLSAPFRREVDQQGHSSIFVGGPGYLHFQRQFPSRAWVANWRPLLYREVEIRKQGEDYLLTPAKGTWSVTPLLYKTLDQLNITLDETLDDVAAAMIEKAVAIQENDGVPLADALVTAFAREIPEVESNLTRRPSEGDFNVVPSPWVLFAPVNKFSALIRQLMSDYDSLVAKLDSNQKNIGGLKLLEDRYDPRKQSQKEILPVIPLNTKQREAVQQIMHGDALTVISGPPGTGKSQVVVSVLLNAWAAGKTVLFASNNNKAVDVVRERIEEFESEFPIAVRAGSKKYQNIKEVLNRTLNMGREQANRSGATELRKKRRQLMKERASLEKYIDSTIPQQISEATRTALEAYGKCMQIRTKISDREQELEDQCKQVGLRPMQLAKIQERFTNTQEWFAAIDQVREQIDRDRLELAEAKEDVVRYENHRNKAAKKLGLSEEEAGDWRWLSSGPDPKSLGVWISSVNQYLNTQPEEHLGTVEWDHKWDQWKNSAEAEAWGKNARQFSEDITSTVTDLAPIVAEDINLQEEKASLQDRFQEANLPTDLSFPFQLIDDWQKTFALVAAHKKSFFDNLPWSDIRAQQRRLVAHERRFFGSLPANTWQDLTPLDDSKRFELADLLNLINSWHLLSNKLKEFEPSRKRISKEFTRLRTRASQLRVHNAPVNEDRPAWERLSASCGQLVMTAKHASEAWIIRERKEETEKKLRNLANQWQAVASGFLLKEAWEKNEGQDLTKALIALLDNPNTDSVVGLRRTMYRADVENLQKVWTECIHAEENVQSARTRVRSTASESDRIASWLKAWPRKSVGAKPVTKDWPHFSKLTDALNSANVYIKNALEFEESEKPRLLKQADKEMNWAIQNLENLIEISPDQEKLQHLHSIVREMKTDPEKSLPVDDINGLFADFSTDKIRAKIERINAQLEKQSFEVAKANWIDRMQKDDASVRAVDALENLVGRSSPRQNPEYTDTFQAALRSVPVWITTAQAAETIPLEPSLFDLVVIDEASQCTLTNILPLIYRAKRLAVIGDSEQLPAIPTIKEPEQNAMASKHGLEEHMSLFGHHDNDVYKTSAASLPRLRADVRHLQEHFRSHPQIIGFSNRHIYLQSLELKKDPQWGNRLPIGSGVHSELVHGIATPGSGGRSWKNEAEANRVIELVRDLREGETQHLSIGIVTPFKPQKELIQKGLEHKNLGSEILTDTAYGFQGDERDVIIFSPVVSKGITGSASRWVEYPHNLINVAITRAREALYVIGDLDYCMRQKGILRKLALYCKDIQLLRDTSPAELELFSWMVVKGWEPKVHPVVGDIELDFRLKTQSGISLYIEVDGKDHENMQEHDEGRDAFIKGQGAEVMRFTAREVFKTPFRVIDKIAKKMSNV